MLGTPCAARHPVPFRTSSWPDPCQPAKANSAGPLTPAPVRGLSLKTQLNGWHPQSSLTQGRAPERKGQCWVQPHQAGPGPHWGTWVHLKGKEHHRAQPAMTAREATAQQSQQPAQYPQAVLHLPAPVA